MNLELIENLLGESRGVKLICLKQVWLFPVVYSEEKNILEFGISLVAHTYFHALTITVIYKSIFPVQMVGKLAEDCIMNLHCFVEDSNLWKP